MPSKLVLLLRRMRSVRRIRRLAPSPIVPSTSAFGHRSRAARFEVLESRRVRASMPYGAEPNDTGEFMLGRVAVTPVLLESDGRLDANTENWNRAHVDQVLSNLNDGLNWWKELLATKSSVHTLDFVVDRTYVDRPVPTAYEPITRVSNDYALWTQEFLMGVGYAQSSNLEENMRAFNHAQRQRANADWSFTIFVVNSEVDRDGTFATGGSFSRAFAFAGGLFFVVPSTRPASTFAHETGHMFWGRDEYGGGSSYYAQRGYYNTQNTNAIDNNPTPGFQQLPSIMSSGLSMQTAFDQRISPASTLAMVGWQDTDGDGVFDVLDVPLRLEGVGRLDPQADAYRFTGRAAVETLPNRNAAGLGNDITLNKVSRIEAKLDSGEWQTIIRPDAYEVQFDISVPLGGQRTGTLQLRAVDDATAVTSNIFEGLLGPAPAATTAMGINGFVWNDADGNGLFDSAESGIAGQRVRVLGANGQPAILQKTAEPDEKLPGILTTSAYPGIALTALGADTNGNVAVFNDVHASTGTRIFRPYSIAQAGYAENWNDRRQLKIQFAEPTSFVSIDAIGSGPRSYGRLEVYNSQGELLDRVTSAALTVGQVKTLALGRQSADIAYAIVRGHMGTGVKLDHLRHGAQTEVTTDAFGRYSLLYLPEGSHRIEFVITSALTQVTSPAGQQQILSLSSSSSVAHVDFGINTQNSRWHNTRVAQDVNDDGHVTPLDALLVINLLNTHTSSAALTGSAIATFPFVDVSNDAYVTALDALLVINALNGGAGEAESRVRGEMVLDTVASTLPNNGGQPAPYAEGETLLAATHDSFNGFWMVPAAGATEQRDGHKTAPYTAASLHGCLFDQLAVDRLRSQGLAPLLPFSLGLAQNESGVLELRPADSSPIAASIFDVGDDVLARLAADPWELPEPCTCSDCRGL